jgi:hemoglobin-like flavoprotein
MKSRTDSSSCAIDIEASLSTVLDFGCERFAGRFYEQLFDGFPELKDLFAGVNMQHQAAMLTMALQVVVQHYRKPRPSCSEYLAVLGHRHHERGVSRNEYEKFEHTLLISLAEFHGNDWHEGLDEQWRIAFGQAVDLMTQE